MGLLDRSSLRVFYFNCFFIFNFFLLLSSFAVCETNHPLKQFVISEVDGKKFSIVNEPGYYGPESLWNYINGGALPYLDYGVSDVVTYTGIWAPDSLEIVVDVYDMVDSLGAFGIYSSERSPEYTYKNIGIDGYLTENTLCFWKDRYYVKVFSNDDSPSIITPIERVAHTIDQFIPEGGGMPSYFSLFPVRDRLEKTELFIARNVLGQDYFRNAFVVNYRRGDEEFQLYLIETSGEEEAEKQFHLYREFIREYGKLEDTQIALGDEVFIGREDWYGLMLFVRKGGFIIGSAGLSDVELAQEHLRAMLSDLSR